MLRDLLGFLKSRRKDAPPYRRVIGRDFWLHDNFGDYAFHGERVLAGVRGLLHYYSMIVHLLTLCAERLSKVIILIQRRRGAPRRGHYVLRVRKFQFRTTTTVHRAIVRDGREVKHRVIPVIK